MSGGSEHGTLASPPLPTAKAFQPTSLQHTPARNLCQKPVVCGLAPLRGGLIFLLPIAGCGTPRGQSMPACSPTSAHAVNMQGAVRWPPDPLLHRDHNRDITMDALEWGPTHKLAPNQPSTSGGSSVHHGLNGGSNRGVVVSWCHCSPSQLT